MNLGQLRAEVLNHGFDPVLFPQGRIDQYINDAYMRVVARVNYYKDEAQQPLPTIAGVNTIAFPPDLGDARSLVDTDQQHELTQVMLGDLDGAPTRVGRPRIYAVSGQGFELYPTPDGIYNLLLRYWALPAKLVLDSDAPTLPEAWHRLLWYWGCKEAYAAEDDMPNSQAWEGQFNNTLSEFTSDVRFPTHYPDQVRSMWGEQGGWAGYGWAL